MDANPKRRLRLSLRALMALVVVLASVLGWLERNASIQRHAVAAIQRSGGHARYDFEHQVDGSYQPVGPLWVPQKLIALIGPDYFGEIVMVDLLDQATDAEMAAVAQLTGVEELYCYGKTVSDDGVALIAGLPKLHDLTLSCGHSRGYEPLTITDRAMEALKACRSLERLTMTMTDVSPEGMRSLARALPGLKVNYYDTRPDSQKVDDEATP